MMDLFRRKKKRSELEDEAQDTYEVDEESDLPIREKITKQKKIRKIRE